MAHPSIAVVGAGAIGGAVAAALGDAGHTVSLCVRTHFATLSRTLDGETSTYPHPVLDNPADAGTADWVLLCTKAHQVEGARAWFPRLVGKHTRIAVLQNGVDHADRVAPYAAGIPVVPVIMQLPTASPAAGQVTQGGPGVVYVPDNPDARAFAALFSDAESIEVRIVEDFVTTVWAKLVHNAAGGAICALSLQPNGVLLDSKVKDLAVDLMREVIAIGRAEGAELSDEVIERTLTRVGAELRDHWTSIAVDRREGRSMEWEARNAVVGRLGRRHGIPTPLNDAVTALLSVCSAEVR